MTPTIMSVLTTLTAQRQQFILCLKPQGRMTCFKRTLLISAGPIKRVLLEAFHRNATFTQLALDGFQWPEQVQIRIVFTFTLG